MQWWCSANSGAWSWTWRPYLGVWLFVIMLVATYGWLVRRSRTPVPKVYPARFGAGILLLWVALDWPVGPLGASYLLSLHMGQYLLIGLLAPLLLLLGIPGSAYGALRRRPGFYRLVETVTHPVMAFLVFNAVLTLSHWPAVVDTLRVSQAGSFVLDLSWLLGGVVFWWPLVVPVPDRSGFQPLARLAYLGLNIVIVRPPMLILFYSQFPAYRVYELAPPLLPGASPVDDQQLAAGIMKLGSSWIFFAAMGVILRRWHLQSVMESARPSPS